MLKEVTLDLPKQIIIATRNRHKALEFDYIFGSDVSILSILDLDPNLTWEETGLTFEQNANIKLEAVYPVAQKLFPGCWVLADDSGICVDALGGAPGVFSSSFGGEEGNHRLNTQRLLKELEGVENRSAYFCCCLVLKAPGLPIQVFKGRVNGKIIEEGVGVNGFGYDPIFVPDGYTQTLAQISSQIKNQISHRARATEALKVWWSQVGLGSSPH